jgi:predicted Rossmann fold flavoprotein
MCREKSSTLCRKTNKILIVGGGAAGLAAAVFSAETGCDVEIFEQNEKLGKKLYITGKGRCNFTNNCPPEDFLSHIVSNPRFLYSSFGGFSNQDAIRFFESAGMKVKEERGGRMFPASDHASDVTKALERRLCELGVRIRLNTRVSGILYDDEMRDPEEKDGGEAPLHERRKRARGLLLSDGTKVSGDAVIVATGGLSYPATGSTGDGLRFAEAAGLDVTETRPALVPLLAKEDYIPEMQGLSLRNVTLHIRYGKKKEYREFGEMLFTHEGVSGPLVLSASSVIGKELEKGEFSAWIDLKPALSDEQLDARLVREFESAGNKELKNVIASLLPAKMRPVFLRIAGISGEKRAREITKKERNRLLECLRRFPFTITGSGTFREAIITQGGVSVKEINPKTMECKKIPGLFFAGEVLDVDGLTGGFNLQIAWTTAHAAALGASSSGEGHG